MYQGIQQDLDRVMTIATDPDLELFNSVANFSAPPTDLVVGAPIGDYTPVDGLQGIPCMRAALSAIRIAGSEVKSLQEIESLQPWRTLLNGFYSQLDGHTEYAVDIDGIQFDILAIEHDSQLQMTRLSLRKVTV